MVAFNRVKVGDVLWDAHKYTMGNTTMRAWGNWSVHIIEIDTEKRRVFASWNGNPAKWYYERSVNSWRRTKKESGR